MPTLAAPELKRFAAALFEKAGFPPDAASHVAEVLVWANLRGVDGHGVQRIPRYMELIDEGNLNPRARAHILNETPAAVVVEGDRGAGPITMCLAADQAVEKARVAGIGLALVRRTTHTAAMGYYTRRAADAGMAALAAAASIPNMPYHGTRIGGISTSAWSVAVPGEPPLVLDMATSVASLGKIGAARRAGTPLPEGWALDEAGNPTTDAAAAELPLPLGGPKGSGLSLLAECIASLITGNPILADAWEGKGDGANHRQNAFLIAIDVARFGDLAFYRSEVMRLANAVKAMPRQAGFDEVLMPGERGDRLFRERSSGGIPVPPATWSDLGKVAERFGVAMPRA